MSVDDGEGKLRIGLQRSRALSSAEMIGIEAQPGDRGTLQRSRALSSAEIRRC